MPADQLCGNLAPTTLPNRFVWDPPAQVRPFVVVVVLSIDSLQQQVIPVGEDFGKVYVLLLGGHAPPLARIDYMSNLLGGTPPTSSTSLLSLSYSTTSSLSRI